MNIVDFLATTSFFHGLNNSQLAHIANKFNQQHYQKNQTIFMEGQLATHLYLIEQGKVKIFKNSAEGKIQILHIFSRGDIFAEVPMFAGTNYPAHAQTLSPTTLLVLSRESLLTLINQDPQLATNMLALLAGRLKEFTTIIENLTLKETTARLANFLLHSTQDIARIDIANLLGTSRENLSRTITKMSNQGLIKVVKKTITILNRQQLTIIARGDQK